MKHRDKLIVGLYVLGITAGTALTLFLFAVLYDMGGWFK